MGKESAKKKRKKEADRRKKREKQIKKFLKPNVVKIAGILLIIGISLIFQAWQVYSRCMQVFCKPLFFGALYYLFWPFDLAAILLLSWIRPNSIAIFISRAVFLVLQAAYWYIVSCAVAVPFNRMRGRIWAAIKMRRRESNRIMREKIKRDIKRAEELEKEKIRLKANKF